MTSNGVRYAATDDVHELRIKRPSIHMPRWASRLTLTVTDVRVERLQAIGRDDAEAEGIEKFGEGFEYGWGIYDRDRLPNGEPAYVTGYAVNSFASLWRHIYGPGAWDANPWVAAITFEMKKGNIDG